MNSKRKTIVIGFFWIGIACLSTSHLQAQYNYFAGINAGSGNSGSYNTGVGQGVMSVSNKGSYNSGYGFSSLASNTTGLDNTAVGYRSMQHNLDGKQNTSIGNESMYLNTSGYYNTASGWQALYNNAGGVANTASGFQSLFNNSGLFNTASGYQSLFSNQSGFNNAGFGYQALYFNNGFANAATGDYSLFYNGTGNFNAAIGYKAGYSYSSNSYCTYLGAFTDGTSYASVSNSTAVGYGARINANNKVAVGNTSVSVIEGQVGWGTFSDGRFKTNIKQNVPGLLFINKLNPVTYNINQEKLERFLGASDSLIETMKSSFAQNAKLIHTGFVAQDVEKTAKEIDYNFDGVNHPQNDKDNYSLVYADFVPSLVKAVQELSKMNDNKDSVIATQNSKIDDLESRLTKIEAAMNIQTSLTAGSMQGISLSSALLAQNVPNPFNNTTTIHYTLPTIYSSAKIVVTDKNGKALKQANVTGSNGFVNIDATTLSSGAYQYSLYVDGRLIESKQMIVAK